MSKTRCAGLYSLVGFVAVLVSLFAAGCGGSEGDLAPVQGTVTLNGQPLVGARIEFEPDTGKVAYGKMSGSTSYGKTDARGRYTLKFTHDREGALVGKHTVRITTRGMTVDQKGKEVWVPERLPPRFNVRSELTREVTSGSNTIDFALSLGSASGSDK